VYVHVFILVYIRTGVPGIAERAEPWRQAPLDHIHAQELTSQERLRRGDDANSRVLGLVAEALRPPQHLHTVSWLGVEKDR
jgi:hypothetical protein